MYDIFYLTDPDPELELGLDAVHVHGFWHCLVESPGLAPLGYLKFSELSSSYKNQDGSPKHCFAGREHILENQDGGFDA